MKLRVVDSHTEGEPTRLVVEGLPDLRGSVFDKRSALERDHDWIRTMVCLEPRGSEIVVGAALFPPSAPGCLADVVYFDNAAYIGMCGHGTIGVMATLYWMGRIAAGRHQLNTVAGVVSAEVLDAQTVKVENVPAFRKQKDAVVEVPGFGKVVGDIAYGGNWFFLVKDPAPPVDEFHLASLTAFTSAVMDSLRDQGLTGDGGARIDHVMVFGPPSRPDADSRNFVLCPGKEYDRSPCGTGTSAKMACLLEDGELDEGQVWIQESVIRSVFRGSVVRRDGAIYPTIEGRAFVTGDCQLFADPADPYGHGVVV
jgi:4-hydroxyproline epimerase